MSPPAEPIVHVYPLSDHTVARRRLMWCGHHNDVAWLYDDDRVECGGVDEHDLTAILGDPLPPASSNTSSQREDPEMPTMTPVKPLEDRWWIMRSDGEMIVNEFLFGDAGDADDPDWVWAAEFDHDEPTEYVCQRFVPGSGTSYILDERRRWFGLLRHAYVDGVCQRCEQDMDDPSPWAYCNKETLP